MNLYEFIVIKQTFLQKKLTFILDQSLDIPFKKDYLILAFFHIVQKEVSNISL